MPKRKHMSWARVRAADSDDAALGSIGCLSVRGGAGGALACLFIEGDMPFPGRTWPAKFFVVPLSVFIALLLHTHLVQIRSLELRLCFGMFVLKVLHEGLPTEVSTVATQVTLQTERGVVAFCVWWQLIIL